jgi:polyvinyl alcohol dehydrogenase (cytochrome)
VIGVASTATAAVIKRDGVSTPALFVGGGDGKFYALDALKGTILWATPLGSPPSHFLWSSPVVYKGSLYIGMASLADCPTVQGQLIQMDQVTGHIQHVFNVVPDDCQGGGIWTSPTIDEQTGKVYVSTGNPDPCWTSEPYASSLLELRASDLTLVDSWQVPPSEWVVDSDFGSSPTLFTALVGGVSRPLVGVAHKNGTYYAFLRDDIGSGPVWRAAIAQGGSCPDCGDGSISTAAWDGTHLYVAGGRTTINGASCYGSVRALNPSTGAALWQQCVTAGPVIAAITAVPGVVVAAAGPVLLLLDSTSGQRVFTYRDPQKGGVFYGPASVSRGALYLGSTNGTLYAFGFRHLKCSCS